MVVEGPYGETTIEADLLLLATGRRPNSDLLNLAATGVTTDARHLVVVDEYQETVVPGIYALGDISSPLRPQACGQSRGPGRPAQPDAPGRPGGRPTTGSSRPRCSPSRRSPRSGLTEEQARQRGIEFVVGRRDYGGTAAGWAREDTIGFVKVLADPATGLLLGAHVIGPEAATVIQPLIQAMSFGQRAHDVARGQYWIHPALPEVVENALLALPKPTGS